MWTDSRTQVQLEEDGGGSTRQSWMETSGLWSTDSHELEYPVQYSMKQCTTFSAYERNINCMFNKSNHLSLNLVLILWVMHDF